ncbi:hypothetical protein LCGC14_1845800, partial [marine sediment metagenome]
FFLASGHGGNDPGAVSDGYTERDFVESVIDKAVEILRGESLHETDLVVLDHEKKLIGNVKYINENSNNPGHDLALEVHVNSNVGLPGTGTETYFGHVEFATEIQEEVVRKLRLKDRGIKPGNHLAFNREVKCASAILELGFVNNPVDRERITQVGAEALVAGILRATGSRRGGVPEKKDPLQMILDLLRKIARFLRL